MGRVGVVHLGPLGLQEAREVGGVGEHGEHIAVVRADGVLARLDGLEAVALIPFRLECNVAVGVIGVHADENRDVVVGGQPNGFARDAAEPASIGRGYGRQKRKVVWLGQRAAPTSNPTEWHLRLGLGAARTPGADEDEGEHDSRTQDPLTTSVLSPWSSPLD